MCPESISDTAPTDIVSMARRTRQHAAAYRETVNRYCAEMPGYLEEFHHTMQAFRRTAAHLREGSPERPDQSG